MAELSSPTAGQSLIAGEAVCKLDDRWRIAIPQELANQLRADPAEYFLAKERPGCVSLWSKADWQARLAAEVDLVRRKIEAGRLVGRIAEVQRFGRLYSTRHEDVQLDAHKRLLIPKRFREFLGVSPGEEAVVLGAAVCLEIWKPSAWNAYLDARMPKFRRLLDQLSQ